ncbi:MAG: tetratricopeptide repeat protein [Acidimicrobiales bacterium]|nr:tetratricopeptide repeat protein [Acidimicrobiales bacterium]
MLIDERPRACPDGVASPGHSLRPFVPRTLLAWLHERPDERWREISGSLLYSDVSGFTALSERLVQLGKRGAEELNSLLNVVIGGMIADCDREGGDVLVFGGDAIVVLFTGSGHAERAARAGHAIRTTVTGRHRTDSGVTAMLRVSTGLHSGEILLLRTNPGHEKLVVAGPAVSALCEAEGTAVAGQVLLSPGAATHLDERYLGARVGDARLLDRRPRAATCSEHTPVDDADGPDEAAVALCVPVEQRELHATSTVGGHRQVAVSFVQFSGVDAMLATHGPAAVSVAIDAMSTEVARLAAEHGTHVLDMDIAIDGGKYYLAAGAPISRERDEERLLRMTLAIASASGPLAVSVGLNRGRVFAGVLGAPTRKCYTCLGDTVNLAARLCARAGAGEVIATSDYLRRVQASTDSLPLEPFTVKGKSVPINASIVQGIGSGGQRFIADSSGATEAAASSDVPLIGRAAELELLLEHARRAERGSGSTVVIAGEPGMGKSRLLTELSRSSALGLLWVDCDPYELMTPYGAVRKVLRPLLGLDVDADDHAVEQRLLELSARAPWTQPLIPLAALAMGVALPLTREVEELSAAFRRSTLHRVVLGLLEVADERSRLIVIDDMYWADEASHDLITALIVFAAGRRWMLCLGTRDEWQPDGASFVQLEALSGDDATTLTRTMLGDVLSDHDRALLDGRGGGNPLFLIELARAALVQGSAKDLPESIESLITARIDLLAPADRDLLRTASVMGTIVDADFLAVALDDPSVADAQRWDRLNTFVAAENDGNYRFLHALGQEAAYEGLPYGRRRLVHLSVATALEGEPDGPEHHTSTIALHFAAGGDHDNAWKYAVAAGDQAKAAFANADAVSSYQGALHEATFVGGLDRAAVARVEEALGDVCDLAGRFTEAADAYRRARRRSRTPRLLRKIGLMYERSGEYDKEMAAFRRARAELAHATAAEDIAERALVLADSAGARYRQGRVHDALELGIKAALDAQASGDPGVLARSTFLLELITSELGLVGKSVELFQAAGDLNGEADAHNNRGIAAYFRGDWTTALWEYEASRELFDRTGDVVGAATAHNNIGEILSDQGRLGEAQQRYERAEQGFRTAAYPIGIAVTVSNRARTAARAGDHHAALQLLDESMQRFENLGAGSYVLEQLARRLECLLLAARWDDAADVQRSIEQRTAQSPADAYTRTVIHRLAGWLALREGRLEQAEEQLDLSLREATLADAKYERALTLLVIAELRGCLARDAQPTLAEASAILRSLDVISVAGWPVD